MCLTRGPARGVNKRGFPGWVRKAVSSSLSSPLWIEAGESFQKIMKESIEG